MASRMDELDGSDHYEVKVEGLLLLPPQEREDTELISLQALPPPYLSLSLTPTLTPGHFSHRPSPSQKQ